MRPLYVEGWPDEFVEIEIRSSVDGSTQNAMAFWNQGQNANEQLPLVVSLHTWAGNYETPDPLAAKIAKAGWNYIHPDFRGPNNNPQACLGPCVTSDIDDAIEFGLREFNADPDRVFVVGMSGGGHAALGHLQNTRNRVAVYSVWNPVVDVNAWHAESAARKNELSRISIEQCCPSDNSNIDRESARNRSPIFMERDWTRLRETKILLRAGVLDGIIGTVPYDHTIRFFNKCVSELQLDGASVSVDEQLSLARISAQEYPRHSFVFSRAAGRVDLKIFFGGHEFLTDIAFRELEEIAAN